MVQNSVGRELLQSRSATLRTAAGMSRFTGGHGPSDDVIRAGGPGRHHSREPGHDPAQAGPGFAAEHGQRHAGPAGAHFAADALTDPRRRRAVVFVSQEELPNHYSPPVATEPLIERNTRSIAHGPSEFTIRPLSMQVEP